MSEVQRQHAELQFADELAALIKEDKLPKPPQWKMSPQAVVTYLMGGTAGKLEVTPKYIGNRRLGNLSSLISAASSSANCSSACWRWTSLMGSP